MTGDAAPFDVFECALRGTTLVEASAGTGKTWSLTGLYLRLVLERSLDVRQILVVTFTIAATAELKSRIRARIAEALQLLRGEIGRTDIDPLVPEVLDAAARNAGLDHDAMARRLDAALHGFDEASIFTIHGFALRAIAETPFAAGLPFTMELVIDDTELRREVVNDFWRRNVAGNDGTAALAAYLVECGDSPEAWAKLVARSDAKPLARLLWPDDIDVPRKLDPAPLDAAFAAVRRGWTAERDAIVACAQAAIVDGSLKRNVYKPASIDGEAREWDRYFRIGDPLGTLPRAPKVPLLALRSLENGTKQQRSSPAHRYFAEADALYEARSRFTALLVHARLALLKRLLDDASPELRARKLERRVMSFDDLLRNLDDALTRGTFPDLAADLRARFPAALIDEFQDTDPLQFRIFATIYRDSDAPVFLVGDPKQAIYRFRHADLYAYLDARELADAAYTLTQNQRATSGLIAAQNALFAANPEAFMLPGLVHHHVSEGKRTRGTLVDDTAARAPLQVWMLPRDGDGRPLPMSVARSAAVHATTAEIARLLRAAAAGQVQLDGRKLGASDIAVLVRTHAQGRVIKAALAGLGIDSVELAQDSVFETPDAADLERVLEAILEPARDRWLRAALATGMLGADAAALEAWSGNDAAFARRVEDFVTYRELWSTRGVGVMYRRLLIGEGVAARMLARPDGERRLTNLLHLGELLQQAAVTHAAPDALVRWLARERRAHGQDEALQLRLESDRDLVQIVTIHKVKGLEFPIVFCPFLWNNPAHRRDSTDYREYHDANRAAVIDFHPRDDSPASKEIDRQIALEDAAEDVRLIYVALTRAAQRCYVVAGAYVERNSTKAAARSPLNWLVAGNGIAPLQWLDADGTFGAIDAGWARLAAKVPPNLAVSALPDAPALPLVPAEVAASSLAPLPPPAHIPAGWRIGSYSALAQGAALDRVAADHDARVRAARSRGTIDASIADDDILRFPRGPAAGDCLHAVFEHADFTAASTWPAAIAPALRVHPPGRATHPAASRWPAMIGSMLHDVLTTPLPGGFALADVAPGKRLTELEFGMPAPHLAPAELARELAAQGYRAPPLGGAPLEGYLKGFIDLVFEHAGRYYVLDWKSNYLGDRADDYRREALDAAMGVHGYHLQSLIYCLALTRYLERRLPAYDHATHFGGALYLFVRGVRPAWTDPRGGAPTGVYFDRPSAATLARLAHALGDVKRAST